MSDLEKLSAKYAGGGSIKAIPRNKAQEILGNKLAGALRKFKDAASVEVPFTDSTLGELLVGKSPEALEDWSYGFGPIRMGRTDQGLMGAVTGMKADPRMLDVAGVAGMGQPLVGPLSRVAKTAVNPKMYKRAFFEAQAPAVKSKIFIGPSAKTWDKDAAQKFEALEKEVGNKEAFLQTGTFRSPDGKLRQEIDDSQAKFENPFPKPTEDQIQEALRARSLIDEVKAEQKPFRDEGTFKLEEFYGSRPGLYDAYRRANDVVRGYERNFVDPKTKQGVFADFFDYPDLYKAYPSTSTIPTTYKQDYSGGSFTPNLNSLLFGQGDEKSIALHEIQHAIQGKEKFATGGSPESFSFSDAKPLMELSNKLLELSNKGDVSKAINYALSGDSKSLMELKKTMSPEDYQAAIDGYRLTKDYARQGKVKVGDLSGMANELWKQADSLTPFNQYKRLAGEAEARAVQARMDMTPEQRRASFPLESYDVPLDELIMKYGGDDPMASIKSIDDIPIEDRLIVQHNLTPSKLLGVERLGGMPVPSLAISRAGSPLSNFGEISLIGRPELAQPSAKNPVFRSDAYTKRKPSIEVELDKRGMKALGSSLGIDDYNAQRLAQKLSDPTELRYEKPIQELYLKSIGKLPNREGMKEWEYSGLLSDLALSDKGLDPFISDFRQRLPEIGVNPKERIFKGYTYAGDRRYAPATLENIVREMKGGAGDEGFNYGLGTVRSVAQPKFKNFGQIQDARGQILSSEDFEPIKKSLNTEFENVSSLLGQFGRYDPSDALMIAAETKRPSELKRLYPEITDEAYSTAVNFLQKIQDPTLPTEYFEIKPQRAVKLNEFAGAILPESSSSSTIDILRRGGLDDLRFYKDEAERAALFRQFPNQMFSAVPAVPLAYNSETLQNLMDQYGEE